MTNNKTGNNTTKKYLRLLLMQGRDPAVEAATTTWTTREGERIEISDMKLGHLLNSMAMLERNAKRALQTLGAPHAEDAHVIEAASILFPQYVAMGRVLKQRTDAAKAGGCVDEYPDDHPTTTMRFKLLELD